MNVSAIWTMIPETVALLRRIQWPDLPESGGVDVVMGEVTAAAGGELVAVGRGSVSTEYAVAGEAHKYEEGRVSIGVSSNLSGRTAEEAFARVTELCAAVECAVRDETTGKPTPTPAMVAANVWHLSISDIEVAALQADIGAWVGFAQFTLAYRARI